MNTFNLILLLLVGYKLFQNFKLDGRNHLKAKITHSITILFLTYFYGGTGYEVGRVFGYSLKNPEYFTELTNTQIGIFSGIHYLIILVLFFIADIFLFKSIYKLIGRDNSNIKQFNLSLLSISTLGIIFLYQGIKSAADELDDTLTLMIGGAFSFGIAIAIMSLYDTDYMKAFFKSNQSNEQNTSVEKEIK